MDTPIARKGLKGELSKRIKTLSIVKLNYFLFRAIILSKIEELNLCFFPISN